MQRIEKGEQLQISFYRPYKGLKLDKNNFNIAQFDGFYRPYKGLKLKFILHLLFRLKRFYRPYKGLKLKIKNDTALWNKMFLSSL